MLGYRGRKGYARGHGWRSSSGTLHGVKDHKKVDFSGFKFDFPHIKKFKNIYKNMLLE